MSRPELQASQICDILRQLIRGCDVTALDGGLREAAEQAIDELSGPPSPQKILQWAQYTEAAKRRLITQMN